MQGPDPSQAFGDQQPPSVGIGNSVRATPEYPPRRSILDRGFMKGHSTLKVKPAILRPGWSLLDAHNGGVRCRQPEINDVKREGEIARDSVGVGASPQKTE